MSLVLGDAHYYDNALLSYDRLRTNVLRLPSDEAGNHRLLWDLTVYFEKSFNSFFHLTGITEFLCDSVAQR